MEILEWGPCVIKARLPIDFVDELVSKAKNEVSANSMLAGHLKDQYFFDRATLEWFANTDHFANAIDYYFESVAKRTNTPKEILTPNLTDFWINYMKPGDFNPPHQHSGALSFIIFGGSPPGLLQECIDHEGTTIKPGEIVFQYGDQANKLAITLHHFHPNKGDFFIFPANVQHFVSPFKSEGTRISISGNVIF